MAVCLSCQIHWSILRGMVGTGGNGLSDSPMVWLKPYLEIPGA
jgi:hypothetical protein